MSLGAIVGLCVKRVSLDTVIRDLRDIYEHRYELSNHLVRPDVYHKFRGDARPALRSDALGHYRLFPAEIREPLLSSAAMDKWMNTSTNKRFEINGDFDWTHDGTISISGVFDFLINDPKL